MDKTSKHRECPRCGLRNRQGAFQCDFCGWDFGSASDEWLDKVTALEQLGRTTAPNEMDQSTIGRIQLTIKKPEEIHVKPLVRTADVAQEYDHTPAVDHEAGDVLAAMPGVTDLPQELAPSEELDTAEDLASPEDEMARAEIALESIAEAPSVEELSDNAPQTPIADPSREVMDVPNPVVYSEAIEHRPEGEIQGLDMTSIGLLAAGAVIYIAAFVLSPAMGKVTGWALAIIGALLITLAAGRWLGQRRKMKMDDELVICSKCHEVVSDAEAECPACGVMFTEPILKE